MMSRMRCLTVRRAALGLCCLMLGCMAPIVHAQSLQESEISINKADVVQITNIDDWLIGVFTEDATINNIQYNWDWQCVYTSTGSYRVEVTSANGGSRLHLKSGPDEMDYWLYVYYRRGTDYFLEGFTTPVVNLNNLSGSTSLTCADEPNGNSNLWFAALVRPPAFNAAPPGIYRDTATITVSPE